LPAAGATAGAILAGGESRRFGSPKALATVGGLTIIERIAAAHRSVFAAVVLVTNEPEHFRHIGLPMVSDLRTDAGPLAGIQAALDWARELGADGVCCTPSDAPFVDSALFRALLEARAGYDAVLPMSGGPLSFEPLFGWYSCKTLAVVEERLAAGEFAVHEFVDRVPRVRRIQVGGPNAALRFLNVNTRDDLDLARRHLREHLEATEGADEG
jgi:molybdopterin-guanine dinucleotide biosynthesis protein A